MKTSDLKKKLTHAHTQTHLYKSMEDLQDLFLNEDWKDCGINQKLADELLYPGQEDLHGCKQRLPLICFPVPETQTHAWYLLNDLSSNQNMLWVVDIVFF